MKRWEYLVEELLGPLDEESINILGAQGWEMFAVERAGPREWRRYIFKRRLRHKPQQVR